MRNRVVVTALTPIELHAAMQSQARIAAGEIQRLASVPLLPGETCLDRAYATTRHALALADAFEILDAIRESGLVPESTSPATEVSSGVMCPGGGQTLN